MDIKFNCSNRSCQQRVSVGESRAGQTVNCPACGTLLRVPISTSIKFTCRTPDCGQHIVVDVSEAGRFVKCPSCGKPMQVPGNPPKSLFPPLASLKPTSLPSDQDRTIEDEELAGPALPPLKRLLYGWGIGMALVAVLLAGSYFHFQMALPKNLKAMASELFAVGDFRGAPVPSHQNIGLLFARNVKDGGAIFFADFSKRTNSILVKHEEGASMDFA